jgi:carbonic anhydrase
MTLIAGIVLLKHDYSMAASVRNDLEWLREDKLIRQELKNTARGFLFDIKTGRAEEIVLS